MKDLTALIIFIIAISIAFLTIYGGDSFSKLSSLRKSYDMQKAETDKVKSRVLELRREINGLQNDDRILEKVARNELGMARHGEVIYMFENYVEQE